MLKYGHISMLNTLKVHVLLGVLKQVFSYFHLNLSKSVMNDENITLLKKLK